MTFVRYSKVKSFKRQEGSNRNMCDVDCRRIATISGNNIELGQKIFKVFRIAEYLKY